MGNAAALLAVKAKCREVYIPLGSKLAVKTSDKYGIQYHLTEIVLYIQSPDEADICPMEEFSINKEPEEFYEVIKNVIK